MERARRVLGVALPALVLLFLFFGSFFAPNDPEHVDLLVKFAEPSAEYPLGTDNLGRCILSRLLYGGRTTLGIIFLGSVIVSLLGTGFGLAIGACRGRAKVVWESLLGAVTAIPPIAYLIIFIAAMGNGIATMLVAVVLSLFLRLTKLVKTRTEVELDKAYVLCAVASGSGRVGILLREVLPNLVADVVHYVLLSGADMVIAIVSFSFIGLGMGDNIIDWGVMIAETHHYIIAHPGMTVYPVVAIVLSAVSLNLLGRAVERRDA